MKNKVACSKYRLKLSALCDLLEIFCTLGLKQVEAPAKKDRFRCRSASKTMNAQSRQKPCVSHARSELRTPQPPPLPPPHPHPHPPAPPQMDRSQGMSADYKIATGQFYFCLDKAAVLKDFRPLRFRSSSNCVNMAQRSIQLLFCFVLFCFCFCFSRPPRPNRVYHRPLQRKKPLNI